MSSPANKWLKLFLQLTVSAVLIAFVIRKINLDEASQILFRHEGLGWLLAAFIFFNLSKIASAFRLNVYQRSAGVVLPEKENLALYYAGMFLNFFLPGGIGGDGYKIYILHRSQGASLKKLFWVTLADRLAGLLMLLLLFFILVPLLDLPASERQVIIVSVLGAFIVLSVFIAGHRYGLHYDSNRIRTLFAYAFFVQAMQVLCMGSLLAYIQLPFAQHAAYLAVFLISSVIAVLPVSFGGLGAREMTFLYGMNWLNLDPVLGVVASSGFFLVTLLSSLPGGLFLNRFSRVKLKQSGL